MGLRKILPDDNKALHDLIRPIVLHEFHGDPQTTIAGDPTLKTMYENYQLPRSAYYIYEADGKVLGGAGVKQLDGSAENICELQRMFLAAGARGKGIGRLLMERCLEDARGFGFEKIYLETLSNMHDAIRLYEKTGFKRIDDPLGQTGHGGCDVRMIMDL